MGEEVSSDKDGTNFPWKPKSLAEVWPEQILASKTSEEETTMLNVSSLKDKYLMLYFSAHWCPPCKAFTPVLSKAYTQLKKERDDFELVFVSSDRDEESFKDYFKEMSFCALPYEHRDAKKALSQRFDISGIPALLMLGPVTNDETGEREIINKNLRGVITSGDLTEFPFYQKKYSSVEQAEDFNSTKCLIIFNENGDDDEQEKVKEVAKKVAEKAKDNDKMEGMNFLWALSSDGIVPRLRKFMNLPEIPTDPAMVILDIPDEGGYYKSDSKDITVESVMKFIETPGDRLQLC